MRVALVHDQLQEFGGAERVLVSLHNIYPEADVYTSFYNPHTLGKFAGLFRDWKIITSWAQRVPLMKKLYSPLRFITPRIWEAFDFSGYDLVISSSGSYMSKGIITKPPTLHICYIHHPPRYLYYYETAREWQKYKLIEIYGHLLNHSLRMWDYEGSQRPDFFIANSEETKKRVKKFYRRDASVIYPPVHIPSSSPDYELSSTNYYLTVSRLAKAKHVDLLVEAANKAKFNFKVVGVGRDLERLKNMAGPTVEFLGNVSDVEIGKIYKNAKAFLFASVDEEFGIAPVEAMGYGLPVIAYASGGLPEFVKEAENGYLYDALSAELLIEKIKELESLPPEKYAEMKRNARLASESFSEENFRRHITEFVNSKLKHI